jgi:hypothetical protein
MAESSLERLFDNLLAVATGEKAAPVDLTGIPGRCSMCGSPGANHPGLFECVGAMRVKLAAIENDPGYLPAPSVPPIPIGPGQQAAYRAYAEDVGAAQAEGERLRNMPNAGMGSGTVRPRAN